MSFFPLAITGAGLCCRRLDREFPAAAPYPPRRFIEASPYAIGADAASLAYAGALEAIREGAFESEACGVCVTVSKGKLEALERQVETRSHEDLSHALECGPDYMAVAIARRLQVGGPSAAAVAACASGLASVKLAGDWIRDGVCRTALAGAAESSRSEMVLRSFERLGVISKAGVTRPFDARRDGFVVGEGAAVFRIEALKSVGPDTPILGKILGIALGADAHHLTSPDPKGTALSAVIERVLELARGVEPRLEIGWVHAHGTGTDYNDRVEASALRAVFGSRIPPITATKGATGHLLGASGAVALGLTIQNLRDGTIPFIEGTEQVAEEFRDLDLVLRKPRTTKSRAALVLNHGFGGHIAAAVAAI